MFIISLLIIGLSEIALGFGVLGMIIATCNVIISIFLTDDEPVQESGTSNV